MQGLFYNQSVLSEIHQRQVLYDITYMNSRTLVYKFLKIAALLLEALCDPSHLHPPLLSRCVSTILALSSLLLFFCRASAPTNS